MARRKKHVHENHERWLVSYADFITLLFAFFVVMFANSQIDKGKAAQISEAVTRALNESKMKAAVAQLFGGAPDDKGKGNAMLKGPGGSELSDAQSKKELAELLPSLEVLSEELKHEIDSGKITVTMEARGLAISFREAALFASGEDVVSAEASDSIRKVADAINKIPNPVRLEGHTDSVPIHTARFRSNWELSAARSIALLEMFAGKFAVQRARMSIGGYADTAPIDSNETAEGRARNRRCDIVILNQTGALGEPESHGATAPPQKPAHH
jgi:chemotaxis protein MotB